MVFFLICYRSCLCPASSEGIGKHTHKHTVFTTLQVHCILNDVDINIFNKLSFCTAASDPINKYLGLIQNLLSSKGSLDYRQQTMINIYKMCMYFFSCNLKVNMTCRTRTVGLGWGHQLNRQIHRYR